MRIEAFYRDRLRAPFKNPRWSWGAVDSVSNRVFLRVWADQIYVEQDGEWVQVYWFPPIDSNGDPERVAQLQAIQDGAEGFAVVCTALDPDAGPRKIRFFDADVVLRLGAFAQDGQGTYAQVTERVAVSSLMTDTTLAQDLAEIIRTTVNDVTTAEALVAARVGQGRFRTDVLQRWQGRCAVTGSHTLEAIRASHIKPWRNSTNAERLDPDNGLPLVASLDALFDAGLISFDTKGQMLIAERLQTAERAIHSLVGRQLFQQPSARTAEYLRYHYTTFATNNLQPAGGAL